MSRKRFIAYAGIALLAGLYTYDSKNKSVTLVPVTVVAVAPITPDEGPDTWEIIVQLPDGTEHASEPLTLHPDVAASDQICIWQEERSWAAPVFRLSDETVC